MRRRRALQTLLATPPAVAAVAASAAPSPLPAQSAAAGDSTAAAAPLAVSSPEAAATGYRTFFSKEQFAALRRLADLFLPAGGPRPSASQTGTPEFLDFLIGQSPAETQQLWQNGLQRLHDENFKPDMLSQALSQPWTYNGPADPFARFLQQAKLDVLQAATSSREWSDAMARSGSGGGRRGAGASTGYFWRSAD